MFNETMVTLQGRVGGDVVLRTAGESVVARFRVACTPRRFSRKTQEWGDGPTQWFTVHAWRALGEHCQASLNRGDPVVVHGRVNAHTYVSKAGVEVTELEVEASFVGHDLSRGTSQFTKAARVSERAPAAPASPATSQDQEVAA